MKTIKKADGKYLKGPEAMLPRMLKELQANGIQAEIVEMEEWDKRRCANCHREMIHDGDYKYYCEMCEG